MFPSAYPFEFEAPRHARRASVAPSFFGNAFDQPCYSLPPEHPSSFDPPVYWQDHRNPYQLEAERRARAQQLRRQREERQRELEQEAEYQRQLARLQHRPRDYHDALRSERARRLAQAQAQQRAQREPVTASREHPERVQVTLPDGRRCVVPIAWAKRMQAKHPEILTDSMITKIRQPSPSPPPEHDFALASESDDMDHDSHDSTFYTLDRSQEPYPPVLKPSPKPPANPSAPAQSLPNHRSRDELDEAARVIQKHIRLHQRIKHLKTLQDKFRTLKAEFVEPSLLDLEFSPPPAPDSELDAPPKLAFNIPANRHLQMFEEMLLKLQIELDGIVSAGEQKIKQFRKEVVMDVEAELERLDRIKIDAWNAQCQLKKGGQESELEIPTAEMSDADPRSPNDSSNDQCEGKAGEADQDFIMSEPPNNNFQSTPPYPSSPDSSLTHEDTSISPCNLPGLLVSQQASDRPSVFEVSPLLLPVDAPDDMKVAQLNSIDVDELIIPHQHPRVPGGHTVRNQDGDIVLPLHEMKSSENILIPCSHST